MGNLLFFSQNSLLRDKIHLQKKILFKHLNRIMDDYTLTEMFIKAYSRFLKKICSTHTVKILLYSVQNNHLQKEYVHIHK